MTSPLPEKKVSKSPPIVLVHGAWHGAWCWHKVIPLLKKNNLTVHAPDLPGHSNNHLALTKVNYKRYIKHLAFLLDSLDRPVTLVGHSMAGMLIASLAELKPKKISSLVFLNAYLPINGDSIFSLMQQLDSNSNVAETMILNKDKRSYSLSENTVSQLFYPQASKLDQEFAQQKIQDQASLPLASRVSLGQHYASVKKVCISCKDDQVITTALQKKMLARQPCDEYILVEGDHSPFFSNPKILADLLLAQQP